MNLSNLKTKSPAKLTFKKTASVLLSVLLSSNVVFANDAGCGLGSMIMRDNTIVSQTLAMTTNIGFFFNQFFGILFGTSNCTSHGLVMREKEQIYYAEANFESLRVEVAQGQGEHLSTLSHLMGCPNEWAGEFGQLLKKNYKEIVSPSPTAVDLLNRTKSIVGGDPVLARMCQPVG